MTTIYMIKDTEDDDHVLFTLAFPDSLAAARYKQRFGTPDWQVIPVQMMGRDEVDALPSRTRLVSSRERQVA